MDCLLFLLAVMQVLCTDHVTWFEAKVTLVNVIFRHLSLV